VVSGGGDAGAEQPEDLEAWKLIGRQAEAAVKARDWTEADRLASRFCALRPDWPNGYALRQETMKRVGSSSTEIGQMLRIGITNCHGVPGCEKLQRALHVLLQSDGNVEVASEEASSSLTVKRKLKGLRLLPHELALVRKESWKTSHILVRLLSGCRQKAQMSMRNTQPCTDRWAILNVRISWNKVSCPPRSRTKQ